jgi:hypothetical protein
MTKCESFPLMIFLGSSYRKHSANYRDKCSYRQSPLAANLFFADKGKMRQRLCRVSGKKPDKATDEGIANRACYLCTPEAR